MAHWYEPVAQAQEAENFRATQQQNRLALKVQQMKFDDLMKTREGQNFLTSYRGQLAPSVQDQPGPAPAPPVQQNTLAPTPIPGAGTNQHDG